MIVTAQNICFLNPTSVDLCGRLCCIRPTKSQISLRTIQSYRRLCYEKSTNNIKHFVGSDLGPNCLLILSTPNKRIYPGIQFRLPCTPPPRTIFHGCQIVYWDPLDGKRRCPQKNFGLGYVKLHGFYANP